jgi:hypothetical protein
VVVVVVGGAVVVVVGGVVVVVVGGVVVVVVGGDAEEVVLLAGFAEHPTMEASKTKLTTVRTTPYLLCI